MNLDDVMRTSINQISRSIEPPLPNALEIRRRARRERSRRLVVGGTAAAAVLAATAVGVWQFGGPTGHPSPSSPSPTTSTSASIPGPRGVAGAVWYSAGVLHDGTKSFPISGEVATNLAVVAGGVLYGDNTGQVIYQHSDGSSVVVGRDAPLGPAGNPTGDIAVWFEQTPGHTDLVVYDLRIGRVAARADLGRLHVQTPESMVGLQQPPVLFVGDAQSADGVVYFEAERSVWRYDWALGAKRPTRVDRTASGNRTASRVSDVARDMWAVTGPGRNEMTFESDDGTVLSSHSPLEPDGSLSSDGHYYVGYSGGLTVVVDTQTGASRPLQLRGGSFAMGVTWARGHTVVLQSPDLSSGGQRVSVQACDAVSLKCQLVTPAVDIRSVTLPAF